MSQICFEAEFTVIAFEHALLDTYARAWHVSFHQQAKRLQTAAINNFVTGQQGACKATPCELCAHDQL